MTRDSEVVLSTEEKHDGNEYVAKVYTLQKVKMNSGLEVFQPLKPTKIMR